MRQCQAAAIAPRRGDGVELALQVDLATLGAELAAHDQSVGRSLGSEGERLHAGQRGGLHSDVAIVDLEMFHHDRHWPRATRGAYWGRRATGLEPRCQHAVNIPLPPRLLHQCGSGAYDVYTLDHETFREQCREVILELHLLQACHLCALPV